MTMAIISYFMLGLELVSEDAAEPFGRSQDDLLLDEICQGLEASIEEVFKKGTPLRKMIGSEVGEASESPAKPRSPG